eukprot:768018-Hanusia_phi.AAC.2
MSKPSVGKHRRAIARYIEIAGKQVVAVDVIQASRFHSDRSVKIVLLLDLNRDWQQTYWQLTGLFNSLLSSSSLCFIGANILSRVTGTRGNNPSKHTAEGFSWQQELLLSHHLLSNRSSLEEEEQLV